MQLAIMSAIDTTGKIDFNTLKTEVEQAGGTVIGTTFPVTVTKGMVAIEVTEYGYNGTSPIVEYKLTKTDGTKIDESEKLLEDTINLNVSIKNIKDLNTITSITLTNQSGTAVEDGVTVDLEKGTITAPITEDGTYTVTIEASNDTGIAVTKNQEITVSKKLKRIPNIPEGWVLADDTNASNDWYAYKDLNEGGAAAIVNAPKLADGMSAIKYETEESSLISGSKWANAMTKDGSMWVWIPRYAYKITSGYHQSGDDINPEDGTLGAGTIEIDFVRYDEDTDANVFLDSSITGTIKTSGITDSDYDESNPSWILAPGFDFGDEHLDGFWFAKFEASNTDGTTANNPNLTLQIKPNVTSWRRMAAADIFEACLKLTSESSYTTYFNSVANVDSHMTKNIEWGAVAYLAHSKYGLNGQEICINTNRSFTTGIGSGSTTYVSNTTNQYNTTTGITASITKNVYGVYDMSGGAWEYVAACLTGYETPILTSNVNANHDAEYIKKYVDVYNAYSTGYNSSKYGDAIYETSRTPYYGSSTGSWFKDCSIFVSSDEGLGVLVRGGAYADGRSAGLFSFRFGTGVRDARIRFPPCIVRKVMGGL